MNLTILERRLLDAMPQEFHEDIQREVAKFDMEINRMSPEENKIGQATLTDNEISRLNTTNQNGNDGLTVIQWQVIKAAAIKFGVMDWTSKVDGSLSKRENIQLLQTEGNKSVENIRRVRG